MMGLVLQLGSPGPAVWHGEPPPHSLHPAPQPPSLHLLLGLWLWLLLTGGACQHTLAEQPPCAPPLTRRSTQVRAARGHGWPWQLVPLLLAPSSDTIVLWA